MGQQVPEGDLARVYLLAGKGGIGLISMRERVASVGGTIDVRSTPGKGTVIKTTIPVVSSDLSLAEFEDRRAEVGKAG